MSRRSTLTAFVLASILALVGLFAAAATDHRDTAFSLDVPDNVPVASLAHGQTLCQGPITVRGAFSALQTWVRPAHVLDVAIRRAGIPQGTGGAEDHDLAHADGRVDDPARWHDDPEGNRGSPVRANAGARKLAFEGGPPTSNSGIFEIWGATTARRSRCCSCGHIRQRSCRCCPPCSSAHRCSSSAGLGRGHSGYWARP